MKPKFLFPSKCRYLGYLLAIPGFILGYLYLYKNYNIPGFELRLRTNDTLFTSAVENFTNELALTLVITGLLLVAFSRVKREDELTASIRLNALYWAILANYGIYALGTLLRLIFDICNIQSTNNPLGFFAYRIDFTTYNLFTPLILFIGIFYYQLYRSRNEFTVKPVRFLPNKPYRFIGKWSFIILVLLIVITGLFHIEFQEFGFTLLPFTLLLNVYSKNKVEDEYIDSVRLEAMQVAVYTNYGILLLLNFFVYGFDFLILEAINLFTIPLIFILWFHYKLYRINKQAVIKTTLL